MKRQTPSLAKICVASKSTVIWRPSSNPSY
jgi:hypothetical protein